MGQGYPGPEPQKIFFDNGGDLEVNLDSVYSNEGDKVTGSVTYYISKPTPPLTIFVSIIGYEEVMWRKRVKRGKETKIVAYRDHSRCCNQKVEIMKSKGKVSPGEFDYPFSFDLPTGIPGSYTHESGVRLNKLACSCTYHVYVELKTNDKEEKETIGRAVSPIIIMQKPRIDRCYKIETKLEKKLRTWYILRRGNVNATCLFDKNIIKLNEIIDIKVAIDNIDCKNT